MGTLIFAIGAFLSLLLAFTWHTIERPLALLHLPASEGLSSDLLSRVLREQKRWRDDFDGEFLDMHLWQVGPGPNGTYPPGLGADAWAEDGAADPSPAAAVSIRAGAAYVAATGIRFRYLLHAPFCMRMRVGKPAENPHGIEHIIKLVPHYGGIALSPGWRCDPDPYLSWPSAEATRRLAEWPGGRACFWNCSAIPVERTLEVSVDAEGIVSLEDSEGCKASRLTWISTPVRVALGCRERLRDKYSLDVDPTDKIEQTVESFPFAGEDSGPPRACPYGVTARYDWVEFNVSKIEPDPLLAGTTWWLGLQALGGSWTVLNLLPTWARHAMLQLLQLLQLM